MFSATSMAGLWRGVERPFAVDAADRKGPRRGPNFGSSFPCPVGAYTPPLLPFLRLLCSSGLRGVCAQLIADFRDDDSRSLSEFLWTPAGRHLIAGLPNAVVAAAAVLAAASSGARGGGAVGSSGTTTLPNPVLAHGHTTAPVFWQSVHGKPTTNAAASTAHAMAPRMVAGAAATTAWHGPTAAQRAANNSCQQQLWGDRMVSQNCTVDQTVSCGMDSAYSSCFTSPCVNVGLSASGMGDLRTIGEVPVEHVTRAMSHEQNFVVSGYGQSQLLKGRKPKLPTKRSKNQRHEEISNHFVEALHVVQQAGHEEDLPTATDFSELEEAAAVMKAGCFGTDNLDTDACFSAEVADDLFPEQQDFLQDISEEDVQSYFRLEVMQT